MSWSVSFLRSSGTEFGFVGSLVQGLHLPADRIRVRGEGGGIEIGLGPWLRVEMAVFVDAAHEHRGIAHLGLANVGRDVADGEADAAGGAADGGGTGDPADVVQGQLCRR